MKKIFLLLLPLTFQSFNAEFKENNQITPKKAKWYQCFACCKEKPSREELIIQLVQILVEPEARQALIEICKSEMLTSLATKEDSEKINTLITRVYSFKNYLEIYTNFFNHFQFTDENLQELVNFNKSTLGLKIANAIKTNTQHLNFTKKELKKIQKFQESETAIKFNDVQGQIIEYLAKFFNSKIKEEADKLELPKERFKVAMGPYERMLIHKLTSQ